MSADAILLTMKRTALTLVLLLLFFSLPQSTLKAQVFDGFEVKKGNAYDINQDGSFDILYFTVHDFDRKPPVRVTNVRIGAGSSLICNSAKVFKLPLFYGYTIYAVDLTDLTLPDRFFVEVTIYDKDSKTFINSMSSAEGIGNIASTGGPGSNPNETVLILEFP